LRGDAAEATVLDYLRSPRVRDSVRSFVIRPHHPDLLRRPDAASHRGSTAAALTWNLFRALELMPPTYWLRRLNAALGVVPSRPAPVTVEVGLWRSLPAPPGVAAAAPLQADVLIETEHAVWALLVCDGADVSPAASDGVADSLTMLACIASWYAGRRACYVGVVTGDPVSAPLAAALVRRYQHSPAALQLRMPRHGYDSTNVRGIGLTTWPGLVTILRDASRDEVIESVERTIAARAVEWCDAALG
jgi:hypothetical protein